VKIDLVMVVDAVAAAGIDELTVAAVGRKTTDIFDEQKRSFGNFLFDNQRRFLAVFRVRTWREEVRFHAGERPAAAERD